MDESTLKELGIDREELIERVVDRCMHDLRGGNPQGGYDEDDWSETLWSKIQRRADKLIAAAVTKVADQEISPRLEEMITKVVLHKTNQWGEKRGEPVTFIEYLVQSAEAYLNEEVTFDGKKPDYISRGKTTRLIFAIDRHLHYAIDRVVKEGLVDLNKAVTDGVAKTIEMSLKQVMGAVKNSLPDQRHMR